MQIFNVVNRQNLLFFRNYAPTKNDYTFEKYLFCREFSGLSDYFLTFKKTSYLDKEPSEILNSTTMRELTFGEWDHGGVFISLGKFFIGQELDMIKTDILVVNFTGYRMV